MVAPHEAAATLSAEAHTVEAAHEAVEAASAAEAHAVAVHTVAEEDNA